MEGLQVKELIQKWRALSSELKGKNAELEKARSALLELESQHAKTVQEWDLEKEGIQNTINLVWDQVTKKKEELQRVEAETTELQRKVDERRLRNEEHWSVLNKRKQNIASQLQELEDKDKGARERLRGFREAREESRKQLLTAIRKLEDTEPQEQVDHKQKLRQLRSKITEIEATIESEKKSWALDLAMNEWNRKNDARKWLSEEAHLAKDSKGTWSELIKEANGLNCDDHLKQLESIRALLSC